MISGCDDCRQEYPGDCPVHGPMIIIPDKKVIAHLFLLFIFTIFILRQFINDLYSSVPNNQPPTIKSSDPASLADPVYCTPFIRLFNLNPVLEFPKMYILSVKFLF